MIKHRSIYKQQYDGHTHAVMWSGIAQLSQIRYLPRKMRSLKISRDVLPSHYAHAELDYILYDLMFYPGNMPLFGTGKSGKRRTI